MSTTEKNNPSTPTTPPVATERSEMDWSYGTCLGATRDAFKALPPKKIPNQ